MRLWRGPLRSLAGERLVPLRPCELPGAGPAPRSPICVLPDSAVVPEEGSPSETHLSAEPMELEDFEATLGTDRRGDRAEAYSRVSASGRRSRPRCPGGARPWEREEGTVGLRRDRASLQAPWRARTCSELWQVFCPPPPCHLKKG